MRWSLLLLSILSGVLLTACATTSLADIESHFSRLRASLPSDVMIQKDPKNSSIIVMKGENLSNSLEQDAQFKVLQTENRYSDIALAFITVHRSVFKLEKPSEELILTSLENDALGFKHVKFHQVYKGIRVWASELIVHIDKSNRVYHVQGRYIPTPSSVYTTAVLSCEDVYRNVVEHLKQKEPNCPNCRCEQVIYSDDGGSRLAYRVVTTPSLIEGWILIVDAQTGKILKKISTIHTEGLQGKR